MAVTSRASALNTDPGSELLFGWPKQTSAIPSATYVETEPDAASGSCVGMVSDDGAADQRMRTLKPPRNVAMLVFLRMSQLLVAHNPPGVAAPWPMLVNP